MFRAVIVAFGLLLVIAGAAILALVPRAWPACAEAIAFGGILLMSMLFERRYRGRTVTSPASSLEATGERFVDPETGKLTEVLYDSRTGERIYRQV